MEAAIIVMSLLALIKVLTPYTKKWSQVHKFVDVLLFMVLMGGVALIIIESLP